MARSSKTWRALLLLIGCAAASGSATASYFAESATQHLQDDSIEHTRSLESPLHDKPVVLVGKHASAALRHTANTITVAAAELPEFSGIWQHAGALAIDGDELAALGKPQLQALLDYVGNCGRVLFFDLSDQIADTLRQQAACSAQALRFLPATSVHPLDAQLEITQLLNVATPALPDAAALHRLSSSGRSGIAYVSVLLGGFTLLFALFSAFPVTRVTALLACPLTAALVLLTGGSRQFEETIAWAETKNGESVARFVAQQSIHAAKRGSQTLQPGALSSAPDRIAGENVSIDWDTEPSARRLDWQATLFQPLTITAHGSFPVTNLLRAQISNDKVIVCNRGSLPSPEAFLHWQGQTYKVPSLAPAQQWRAEADDFLGSFTAPLRLLSARTSSGVAAILYRVPSASGAPDSATVWLTRFEYPPVESAPCEA